METCRTLMCPIVAVMVTQLAQREKNGVTEIIFLPVVSLSSMGMKTIKVQAALLALKCSRDQPPSFSCTGHLQV